MSKPNPQGLPIWTRVDDAYPEQGALIEILHFGGCKGAEIYDTATVDEWGICPDAKEGGHGKRSTITHWRLLEQEHAGGV